MFKQAILVSAISAIVATAAHADYQYEVGGAYATGEITAGNGADADQDLVVLGGSYYLEAVDSSKGPRSENAFVDRASNISLAYTFGEIDVDNGGDTDINNIAVNGRYVIKDSGFLVELGYQFDDGDNSADSDAYAIRFGKYIAQNTTIVGGWAYAEDDDNRESDEFTLELEHLEALGDAALKVEAGIGLVDSNFASDVKLYTVGATYYVNNNLGFGASYSLADSNDTEVDQYTAFGELWVNEQVSVSLGYTAIEEDGTNLESDAVVLAVTGRF
ncbi:MAG: putative porin [Halioglobus sp.]